ncbi:hypothetical protein IAU59_002935 [Kwoniella sp. CBS 9459]
MTSPLDALPQVQLDHIVLLLPLEQLRNPPSWLTDSFTIIPGGKHAGGVTENSLVLLQDGVYIELISFSEGVSEEERAKHFWGKKPYGVIDYAFTISVPPGAKTEAEFEKLRTVWKEAGVDEGLIPPYLAKGGRTRPDGQQVEWRIAFPSEAKSIGTANFWCIDVTRRDLRVPISEKTTTHPSKAQGVASLSFRTRIDDKDTGVLSGLSKLFASYLKPTTSDNNSEFSISTPVDAQQGGAKLVLEKEAKSFEERQGEADEVEIRLAFNTSSAKRKGKIVEGDIGGRTVEFAFV